MSLFYFGGLFQTIAVAIQPNEWEYDYNNKKKKSPNCGPGGYRIHKEEERFFYNNKKKERSDRDKNRMLDLKKTAKNRRKIEIETSKNKEKLALRHAEPVDFAFLQQEEKTRIHYSPLFRSLSLEPTPKEEIERAQKQQALVSYEKKIKRCQYIAWKKVRKWLGGHKHGLLNENLTRIYNHNLYSLLVNGRLLESESFRANPEETERLLESILLIQYTVPVELRRMVVEYFGRDYGFGECWLYRKLALLPSVHTFLERFPECTKEKWSAQQFTESMRLHGYLEVRVCKRENSYLKTAVVTYSTCVVSLSILSQFVAR